MRFIVDALWTRVFNGACVIVEKIRINWIRMLNSRGGNDPGTSGFRHYGDVVPSDAFPGGDGQKTGPDHIYRGAETENRWPVSQESIRMGCLKYRCSVSLLNKCSLSLPPSLALALSLSSSPLDGRQARRPTLESARGDLEVGSPCPWAAGSAGSKGFSMTRGAHVAPSRTRGILAACGLVAS